MDRPEVTEVKKLISDLQLIEQYLPQAISNWRPNCIGASNVLLRAVCRNPGIIKTQIFSPLYTFLNTYVDNREGKIAPSQQGLRTFLLNGLESITNYIILSDFFARNPHYRYPRSIINQEKYKELMFDINKRLIGCKDDQSFDFLRLISKYEYNRGERVRRNYLIDICRHMVQTPSTEKN